MTGQIIPSTLTPVPQDFSAAGTNVVINTTDGSVWTITKAGVVVRVGPFTGTTGYVYTSQAANFNASGAPAGFKITANNVTVTLPAAPADGDTYFFVAATSTITGCVIARNGKTIMGIAQDMTVDKLSFFFALIYDSGSGDWRLT